MPADAFFERPATANVAVGAGGHLTTVAYTWEHPADGSHEGLLVVGVGSDPVSAVALWADSWHQQPAPISMAGTAAPDGVEVAAEYGGGWVWRIAVRLGAGALTVQMDNVVPDDQGPPSGPYAAMLMELRPA